MTHSDDEDWLYRRGSYHDEPTLPGADPGQLFRDEPRAQPGSTPPEPSAALPPVRPAPTPMPAPAPVRARRRGGAGRVLRTGVVLVLVYLLGPLGLWLFLDRVDAAPSGERPADQPGQVYVLAGSDSREGLSPQEQERLGTGSDAGNRADTIMLLYVPRDGGRTALVSVPRDSFVTIPGEGRNKINAAYALGGPDLLVAAIEASTGVRVDGYAEVGFGGFVNAVDAVGGIQLCPPEAISDRDSNLDIPAGCQQMDGATALGYVRMRKADPRGDLGRAERQREMLGALAGQALSPATVVLPWRWWGLHWALSRSLTVGRDTGPLDLGAIGWAVVSLGTGRGVTTSVPVADADATTSAGSSVLWDEARAEAMFAAMREGRTIEGLG